MLNRGRAATFSLFRNKISGIKNLSLHKRFFLSKIMPILHYGAEIWGHENAAQLESVQLGYFKRLYGLHRMTHTQFLKGDLGLWSLKSYRTVQMIKFWLKVVQLPSDRLLKAAYDELLQLRRKRSWPSSQGGTG